MCQAITLGCGLLEQNLKFLNFTTVEIRMGLDITDVITDFINLVKPSMGLKTSDFPIFC